MSSVVVGRQVWPRIARILDGNGPKRVAVAFLGADADDLLKSLAKGDLLVCNAGVAALKSGATNPAPLRALLQRGVQIRSHPRLHAKIYVSETGAFIGSANASATAIGNEEAGVVLTTGKQLTALCLHVEALGTDKAATRVDGAFIDLAETLFRPARGGAVGGGRDFRTPAKPLWFYEYGDEPPSSVEKAAEYQLDEWDDDDAGTIDYSWGPKGAWTVGARCVWVERNSAVESKWDAAAPAVCVHRAPVGGRSTQWLYWWRTLDVDCIEWGDLRRHVLVHSGVSIRLDTSTRRTDAIEAVFGAFGVSEDDLAES